MKININCFPPKDYSKFQVVFWELFSLKILGGKYADSIAASTHRNLFNNLEFYLGQTLSLCEAKDFGSNIVASFWAAY